MKTLVIVVCTFFYCVAPIDLLPDVIPFLGWADDIGLVAWAANSIFNTPEAPSQGANDVTKQS